MQCVAVYSSRPQRPIHGQCVAVKCSTLQSVAVCCSVLYQRCWERLAQGQCVAAKYSTLQCVAVCCSVLQCVAPESSGAACTRASA